MHRLSVVVGTLSFAIALCGGACGNPPPDSPSTDPRHTTYTPGPAAATAAATSPCGASTTAPPSYDHVIWIWMENHTYAQVIGNANAPYTTQLAQQCATATNYATVGSPSLPNYIGATAGSTFGITNDNPPSANAQSADNLFRQVRSTGRAAKSYQESMPLNCALSSSGTYAVKHNPAAYYVGPGDRTACQSGDVPMGTTTSGAFLDDLTSGNLPAFSFITPNLCNDTHDCAVSVGDAWLQDWVPIILASGAYQAGKTALVIVYDEPTPMPNVLMAPSVPPGTQLTASVNHYSLLRTTEEMLGITPLLGAAATAPSMLGAFGSPQHGVGGIAEPPEIGSLPRQ